MKIDHQPLHSTQSPAPAKTRPDAAPGPDEDLLAELEQRRQDLASAAGVLQKPLRSLDQTDAFIRRIRPALPYAVAALTVAGLSAALLQRRRLRPSLLIATGLDLWRLWKGIKSVAVLADSGGIPYTGLQQGARPSRYRMPGPAVS